MTKQVEHQLGKMLDVGAIQGRDITSEEFMQAYIQHVERAGSQSDDAALANLKILTEEAGIITTEESGSDETPQ